MHPIVGKPGRLGLYVLAWVPLGILVAYFLKTSGLTTLQSAVFVVPLIAEYAAICLVAWYPCRATPLHAGFVRIVTTHLAAAVLFSATWTLLAVLYANVISLIEPFAGLKQHQDVFPTVFAVGILLYLLSVALHYVLLATERSREAEQHASEAKVLARDAELRALKAQINPHFLFNSLHSISALTTIDPSKAREMTILLADFLRSTLGLGEKTLIPLEEEVALVQRFLAVEKVRFGRRLQVEERFSAEAMPCLVPPLLLQPLVENAVGHGIANLPEGGWVRISADYNDSSLLTLSIENSYDPEFRSRRKQGIGMSNVRERLLTRYGKNAAMIATAEEGVFRVVLTLPVERSTAS